MSRSPDEPRIAHYLYAHRALPRAFLRDPASILDILASTQAMEFLAGMWGVLVGELEPADRMSSEGLALACYELGDDVFVAVVTMPEPRRGFEAHHVAMVARFDGPEPFARCFTLDRADPPGAAPDTGILEWDAEGGHELRDTGCPPDATAFLDALEAMLID